MITYKKGDLFADKHPAIAHGVNCQGVMGSGVAKEIKQRFPWAYDDYCQFCKSNSPKELLGLSRKSTAIELGYDTIIYHCFTQLTYGKEQFKRYVSYDAIDKSMYSLRYRLILQKTIPYVAMPKIGAGLGGGDWNIIESIINTNLADVDVVVYEL